MVFYLALRQNGTGCLEDGRSRGRRGVDGPEGSHSRYREADQSTAALAHHAP